MIPETTKDTLLKAMDQFDNELRDSADWANWESRESHRYAIEHEGRRYPVKKVISMATNTPVASFSGGDEANSYAAELGFTVVSLRPSTDSMRALLQQILDQYRAARTNGGFGKSHPLWQAFIRLQAAIESQASMRSRRSMRVEWSVGKGNWAAVPWLAIIDASEKDAPRGGVYGVFLFREDMSGVYLTLNQGVTNPKKEKGASEARRFLRDRAVEIRSGLADLRDRSFLLDTEIDLRNQGLGADYEDSTIAYKLYETHQIPPDLEIAADLDALLRAYETAIRSESISSSVLRRQEKRTWIFQANPKLFDLSAALSQERQMTWLVNQQQGSIHAGDTAYLWESGPDAGIAAIATVTSEPAMLAHEEQAKKYARTLDKFEGEHLRVWLEIERVLPERLLRVDLLNHPVLRSLGILAAPQGTNFAVTSEQATALKLLVDGKTPQAEFARASATFELVQAIEAVGFVFEPWQIAAYVTALRTKSFVILAGVTGTGKSKLPALVARLTGGESDLIPVRPDWTDSADVLGYVDLQGKFRAGRLLQVARKAAHNPHRHWVCIVDEMNLARVEQYFAEVLSRMEDRIPSADGGYQSRPLVGMQLSSEDQEWGEAGLPANLGLVGTVNMDETTHGFSRKVLDRAFTIELSDTDLTRWSVASSEPSIAAWPAAAWHPRAASLAQLASLTEAETDRINSVISVLTTLNGMLQHAQLQIGYRSRDEIALFVLHASEIEGAFLSRDGSPVDPLDLAIHMKVLPRIAGGSAASRRAVLQLLGWARGGKPLSSEDAAQSIVDEWSDLGRPGQIPGSVYPRTAARLCIMWERFLSEGYTSYWL